jgi:hypothetical protein
VVFLIAILTVVLLALVVLVVSAPLRGARRAAGLDRAGADPTALADGAVRAREDARRGASGVSEVARRDELEAAREAKYREIRDAELDFRTGKLSHEDYKAIDDELRAEAIEILNRIEELTPRDA